MITDHNNNITAIDVKNNNNAVIDGYDYIRPLIPERTTSNTSNVSKLIESYTYGNSSRRNRGSNNISVSPSSGTSHPLTFLSTSPSSHPTSFTSSTTASPISMEPTVNPPINSNNEWKIAGKRKQTASVNIYLNNKNHNHMCIYLYHFKTSGCMINILFFFFALKKNRIP